MKHRPAAQKTQLPALRLARFEHYTKARSAQILHIGSYDDEDSTLEHLHEEFLPTNGLAPKGHQVEDHPAPARHRSYTVGRSPTEAGWRGGGPLSALPRSGLVAGLLACAG